MKCYAVIDTNVLVSALLSKKEEAATVQLLERLWKRRRHETWVISNV